MPTGAEMIQTWAILAEADRRLRDQPTTALIAIASDPDTAPRWVAMIHAAMGERDFR